MVFQLHRMVQIQLNLLSIKCMLCLMTLRQSVSVFKEVFNVDVIIAIKSPILKHLDTSMYFRVSDKMLLNFDI